MKRCAKYFMIYIHEETGGTCFVGSIALRGSPIYHHHGENCR